MAVPPADGPLPPRAVEPGPQSADRSIALEVIEYGDEAPLALSGKAPPGAKLEAYLGSEKLGRTEADQHGNWQVTAPRQVPTGRHRLRVDRIDESGEVAARLVMFFDRAQAPTPETQSDFVIVQPGNSLWRIARRVYGAGIRYTQIYQANRQQIADPDLIYPGQVFRLPAVDRAQQARPEQDGAEAG